MNGSIAALGFAARHGRLLLVAGLVVGALVPGLAAAMRPWLGQLVALLLFLAALRIGPRQALGALSDLRAMIAVTMIYQLLLPLAAIGAIGIAGGLSGSIATALILMLSAPSISGSPNLTVLTGNDPTPALRLLVVGTALLPLTVIPVFWLIPAFGETGAVLAAAGRLLGVIAAAGASAFAIRALILRQLSRESILALDGLSAIAMSVVVIGLMSAIGPAIATEPSRFLMWLAIAFAANFGLQIAASLAARFSPLAAAHAPLAIVAGNRNIALFLVALSAQVTDPILLFIGCYQIPMYLTPILLRRLYVPK